MPVGIFDPEQHPADGRSLHAVVRITERREPRRQLLDGVVAGPADGGITAELDPQQFGTLVAGTCSATRRRSQVW